MIFFFSSSLLSRAHKFSGANIWRAFILVPKGKRRRGRIQRIIIGFMGKQHEKCWKPLYKTSTESKLVFTPFSSLDSVFTGEGWWWKSGRGQTYYTVRLVVTDSIFSFLCFLISLILVLLCLLFCLCNMSLSFFFCIFISQEPDFIS